MLFCYKKSKILKLYLFFFITSLTGTVLLFAFMMTVNFCFDFIDEVGKVNVLLWWPWLETTTHEKLCKTWILCIPANNGKSSQLYKHYFEDTEKRKENKGSRVQDVFQNNHSFNL